MAMGLAKVCTEYMVKHAVPGLERLRGTSRRRGDSNMFSTLVTTWRLKHLKVLQKWESVDFEEKADTMSFIAQCCAYAIASTSTGSQELTPPAYLENLYALLEQIGEALPSDGGYFGKIRRCCFAIYRDCLRLSAAASSMLDGPGNLVLDLNPRTALFNTMQKLEGCMNKWCRAVKGYRGTNLPGTDKWPVDLVAARADLTFTIQELCEALDPSNPEEPNSEGVTTKLRAVRLKTPKVVAFLLCDLMAGLKNDTLFYDRDEMQFWVEALPGTKEKYSTRFTDAELTGQLARMSKDVLDVLANSWGSAGPTENVLSGLQRDLQAMSKDILTERVEKVFRRAFSKDLDDIKHTSRADSSNRDLEEKEKQEIQLSSQLKFSIFVFAAHWLLSRCKGDEDTRVASAEVPRPEGHAGVQSGQYGSAKQKENAESMQRQLLQPEPEGSVTFEEVAPEELAAVQEMEGFESTIRKSDAVIRSAGGDPSATPEKAEVVEGNVVAHEERARPSVHNLWDVEEVKLLLEHYMKTATENLSKHGVPGTTSHGAIDAFLKALPGIKEKGITLSNGHLHQSGIKDVAGADADGALAGASLPSLVKNLQLATIGKDAELCHGVTCGSIARDMCNFHESFQVREQALESDAPDRGQHLQEMGFALLDVAKFACRLMMALLQEK